MMMLMLLSVIYVIVAMLTILVFDHIVPDWFQATPDYKPVQWGLVWFVMLPGVLMVLICNRWVEDRPRVVYQSSGE